MNRCSALEFGSQLIAHADCIEFLPPRVVSPKRVTWRVTRAGDETTMDGDGGPVGRVAAHMQRQACEFQHIADAPSDRLRWWFVETHALPGRRHDRDAAASGGQERQW